MSWYAIPVLKAFENFLNPIPRIKRKSTATLIAWIVSTIPAVLKEADSSFDSVFKAVNVSSDSTKINNHNVVAFRSQFRRLGLHIFQKPQERDAARPKSYFALHSWYNVEVGLRVDIGVRFNVVSILTSLP